MTIPTMLTLKEAAQKTGLSYDCLRKLCLQNKIVYIRAGCKFLINQEKLVEYLNGGVKRKDGDKQQLLQKITQDLQKRSDRELLGLLEQLS